MYNQLCIITVKIITILLNKGTVGKVADNLLKQTFDATSPFTVLHTDVSQVRLGDSTWAYMSVILDQATKEVLLAKAQINC